MQVIDFSKKYEIPKGCGNHAEIFPKNIFCVIASSTGCGKTNLMVNLLLQDNKSIIVTCTFTVPLYTSRHTFI